MFHKGLLLLFLMGLSSSPVAAATTPENNSESYLAVQLNYADPDSVRRVDGQGLGATLLYGHEIYRNWFMETRVSGFVLERGSAGGTDFYQQDIGVDAVYRFGDSSRWQPFVLAGVSAIRNDVDIPEQDGIDVGVHVGGGVTSAPLGNMGIRFRADVRYVHDQFLDGVQDVRLGIGIEIPLGGERGPITAPGAGMVARGSADDRDSDGVADYFDRCQNSLPYVKHDEHGCMQPDQIIRMYEVTFNNGTSILTPAARAELVGLVLALRGQPDLQVQVRGHTDSWGSTADNRRLSLERAEAVATYLTLQGVSTQRLSVEGYGESRPVDSNATEEGRERNRRIEIVLLAQPEH